MQHRASRQKKQSNETIVKAVAVARWTGPRKCPKQKKVILVCLVVGIDISEGRAHQALKASLQACKPVRSTSGSSVTSLRPWQAFTTGVLPRSRSIYSIHIPSLAVPNIRTQGLSHPLPTFAPRATRRPIQPAHQYAAQPTVQRHSRIQIARIIAITHTSRPRRLTRRPRLNAQPYFFSPVAAALAPTHSQLHVAVWAKTQKGR